MTKYYEFLDKISNTEKCMYLATKKLEDEFEGLSFSKANDILLDWIVDTNYFENYINK